jgi:hypothetical protein
MNNIFSININSNNFSLPNDAEFITGICSCLPEHSAPVLLVALASHHSSMVRCTIASRSDLPVEAVECLIAGGNRQVRRTLVHNDVFKTSANTDLLIEWCADDAEFAAAAASQITEFENADTEQLFAVLSEHADPDVRRELARAWNLPKSKRKKFLNDADFGVARIASES